MNSLSHPSLDAVIFEVTALLSECKPRFSGFSAVNHIFTIFVDERGLDMLWCVDERGFIGFTDGAFHEGLSSVVHKPAGCAAPWEGLHEGACFHEVILVGVLVRLVSVSMVSCNRIVQVSQAHTLSEKSSAYEV